MTIVGVVLLTFLASGAALAVCSCAAQSRPQTATDEKALAACVAREGAKELEAGSTPLDAAEVIAIACGTDAATVIRDLVFGEHQAPGTRGYAVQHAGKSQ